MFNKSSLARIENKEIKFKKKDAKFFAKFGVHLDKPEKKKKVKIKDLKLFFPYLKKYQAKLIAYVFVALGLSACSIFWPMLMTHMVDNVAAGNLSLAILFGIGYFGIEGFLSFFYLGVSKLSLGVFTNAAYDIRADLIKELANTKVSKFNSVSSGDILSRINTDPGQLAFQVNEALAYIPATLRQAGRIVLVFTYHWSIGILFIVGGLIIYSIANWYIKSRVTPVHKAAEKLNDDYVAQSNEMVRGIRDIKNLNVFPHFFSKFKTTCEYKAKAEYTREIREVTNWEINYGLVVCLVEFCLFMLSVYLLSIGTITLGIFSTLLVFSYDILCTFTNASKVNTAVKKAEVHAGRINEIFDEQKYPKEVFGNKTINKPKGGLEFRNVDFNFEDKQVFSGLNFKIKPGECVGIVGKSGEGKSTILNLIPRIYDVEAGEILIDKVNVKELNTETLRNIVSVVPQSPYIFNMSIKENLKLVKTDATDEELKIACKKANIFDFIKSKESGFDTIVGEGGVILSGGQKQRLAIARAFLKDSKILLLDEATSALDNESQNEIKKAISELKSTCTIIIVAHRLSTVSDCDRIFVLNDHKLAGAGAHEELMQTCEIYKNLYKQAC